METTTKTIHVGGNKMEGNTSEVNKGLNYNAIGAKPTGEIYSITTETFATYFKSYFERAGYTGIIFMTGKCNKRSIPPMFLVFPKNKELINSGRTQSDKEVQILGGRSHGAHIRLDGKLYELVRPFVSDKRVEVKTVRENNKYCFISLDPNLVIANLFGQNRMYEVMLLDTADTKGSNCIFKIAKQVRPMEDEEDITAMLKSIC